MQTQIPDELALYGAVFGIMFLVFFTVVLLWLLRKIFRGNNIERKFIHNKYHQPSLESDLGGYTRSDRTARLQIHVYVTVKRKPDFLLFQFVAYQGRFKIHIRETVSRDSPLIFMEADLDKVFSAIGHQVGAQSAHQALININISELE